jgi:hypothetical protein
MAKSRSQTRKSPAKGKGKKATIKKKAPRTAARSAAAGLGTCTVTILGVPASRRNYTREDCDAWARDTGGTASFSPYKK